MLYNWKYWRRYLQKRNGIVVKLGLSILLVAFAYRFICSQSTWFLETSVRSTHFSPAQLDSISSQQISDSSAKCNLFMGEWIPNQGGPIYTNETCSFISDDQNCNKNGRPDTGYLYWRWKPRGCELPLLDPRKFLEHMRNKSWAFIGDSISRNHVESLLCILSTVDKAIEVDHDAAYRSRRWIFPSYNLSLSVIWSPFLAEAVTPGDIDRGVLTAEVELQLDKLDAKWAKLYKSLDFVIFSSGMWFIRSSIYYEKNTVLGCHSCPGRNLTQLGFEFAYQRVLRNVFDYIISSKHKGTFFYRTSTPYHFEKGDWNTGGKCKRTKPARDGEVGLHQLTKILYDVELEEFHKVSARASEKGVNLKLFNITPLSLLRPDGHPGRYRSQPHLKDENTKIIYDCLHWCLPGPTDSWNDLLMEMVVNS